MNPADLKKWMDERGLLAAEVASMAHVSERTIYRFLEGKTTPKTSVRYLLEKLVEESAPAPLEK